MIISVDAEETSDKFQHPLMIKNSQQTRNERNILNLIKKENLQNTLQITTYLMVRK